MRDPDALRKPSATLAIVHEHLAQALRSILDDDDTGAAPEFVQAAVREWVQGLEQSAQFVEDVEAAAAPRPPGYVASFSKAMAEVGASELAAVAALGIWRAQWAMQQTTRERGET